MQKLNWEKLYHTNYEQMFRTKIEGGYLYKAITTKYEHNASAQSVSIAFVPDNEIIQAIEPESEMVPKEFLKAVYNIVYGLDIYSNSNFATVSQDNEFEACLNVIKAYLPK